MIVYGRRALEVALESCPSFINEIYLGKEIDKSLFKQLAAIKKPILRLDAKKMQALAKSNVHQGIIFDMKDVETLSFGELKLFNKIIVLCGLQDMGNIGSIVRSTLALGFEGLLLDREVNLSTIARASSGAIFKLPFSIRKDLIAAIVELKAAGFYLIGSNLLKPSTSISQYSKLALFVGAEETGMPKKILSHMDGNMNIKTKNFNSLNVAVAAGILMSKVNDGCY